MADQAKVGKDWGDDELDAIVADYFAMLLAERAGEAYVKAHHSKALMDEIGRTHRSVEFKHMNISAVLRELGLPTVRGYKPKLNIQNAIFGAIERHLSANPGVFDLDLVVEAGFAETQSLFEESPPAPNFAADPKRRRLERLIRKFDPSERDFRNRKLGKDGEALILDFERHRLAQAERRDLAGKVRWVSQEDGDGAGYDILSFDPAGRQRMIEVKTTCGTKTTPFFLTSNERSFAEERPEAFRLYRVYEFGEAPRFFKLRPPLQQAVVLEPATYRASFG
ncbi:MAG: protein NO VEIN domain-containing protein [Caulobacteraceae bacterium]